VLSEGTRIGPFRIRKWIHEGGCGQSYEGEQREGSEKGKSRYLKLLPRELSEKEGFSEFFSQECRALEQLQGPGIWELKEFGVMKWKHWLSYSWFPGEARELPVENEDSSSGHIDIRTLKDWIETSPGSIGPGELLSIMTDLHRGLDRAHKYGVIHGNLKPSNVLAQKNENGYQAWLSELGLYKLFNFKTLGEGGTEVGMVSTPSMQAQESRVESDRFRPKESGRDDELEETWDLHALGSIVHWVIEHSTRHSDEWIDWLKWAGRSVNFGFPTAALSMEAMPGMEDTAQYGVKVDHRVEDRGPSAEEIKRKRELAWEKQQITASLKFKRGMTGLAGLACLASYICSSIYLLFFPAPWTEYSLEGALDRYQFGLGIWSGQAWGIVPGAYDDDGLGGQDVVGEWERENGIFVLKFRRFRKLDEEESGKKLWQFIGKGATSDDDYHSWQDELSFDPSTDTLALLKRTDVHEVYVPGKRGDESPRLFAEIRLRRSSGKIAPAELIFSRSDKPGPSWSLFFALGFLLAWWLYQRQLLRLAREEETGK